MSCIRSPFPWFSWITFILTVSACAGDPPATGNLALWLKADSLKLKDGQKVAEWSDDSGRRNTPENSSESNQPIFVADGPGGKPAVKFDGADDFLKLAYLKLPEGLTYAVVLRTTSKASEVSYPGNAAATLVGDHTGSVWHSFGVRNGSIQYNYYRGEGEEESAWMRLTTPQPVNDGKERIVVVTHSATDGRVDLHVNGDPAVSDQATYSSDVTGFDRIGSGYCAEDDKGAEVFSGEIAELLVYSAALSNADRSAVEKYLGEKYRIPISGKKP